MLFLNCHRSELLPTTKTGRSLLVCSFPASAVRRHLVAPSAIGRPLPCRPRAILRAFSSTSHHIHTRSLSASPSPRLPPRPPTIHLPDGDTHNPFPFHVLAARCCSRLPFLPLPRSATTRRCDLRLLKPTPARYSCDAGSIIFLHAPVRPPLAIRVVLLPTDSTLTCLSTTSALSALGA